MKIYRILQNGLIVGTITGKNETDAIRRYKKLFWMPGNYVAEEIDAVSPDKSSQGIDKG